MSAVNMKITLFPDVHAQSKAEYLVKWEDLLDSVLAVEVETKEEQPMLKFAEYGDARSALNALRFDENVLSVFGIEGDYDAGEISIDAALDLMEKANIECVIYPSSGYTVEHPKWRILCPFKQPFTGTMEEMKAYRKKMVQRIDNILGNVLDRASYTLSLAFYCGRVTGMTAEANGISGRFIDECDDLNSEPPVKAKKKTNGKTPPTGTYDAFPFDEHVQNLFSENNYHGSAKSLTSHYAGKQMNLPEIIDVLEAIFLTSQNKGEKWADRMHDVIRLAKTAYDKFHDDVKFKKAPTDIYDLTEVEIPEYDPDAFPDVISGLAQAVHDATGGDPTGSIIASLAACTAALDNRIKFYPIPMKAPTFKIISTMFCGPVADPSAMKSPLSEPSFAELEMIQDEIRELNKAAWARHVNEHAVFKKKHTIAVAAVAKGEPAIFPIEPQKPEYRQLMVKGTATIEGVEAALERSPQGAFQYTDELAAFFGSHDRYHGGGGDGPQWIILYEGGQGTSLRSGHTRHFSGGAGVYGTIQPQAMRKIAEKLVANGLLARFLFVTLRNPEPTETTHFNTDAQTMFDLAIRTLVAKLPHEVKSSVEAEKLFTQYFDENAKELRRWDKGGLIDEHIIHALGKSNGHVARLALLFHELKTVGGDIGEEQELSAETAQEAIDCYRMFIKPHLIYFHYTFYNDDESVRLLADRLLAKGAEWGMHVGVRDIRRSLGQFKKMETTAAREEIIGLMSVLEHSGWVRNQGKSEFYPLWRINPKIFSAFSERQRMAVDSLAEVKEAMKEKFEALKQAKPA